MKTDLGRLDANEELIAKFGMNPVRLVTEFGPDARLILYSTANEIPLLKLSCGGRPPFIIGRVGMFYVSGESHHISPGTHDDLSIDARKYLMLPEEEPTPLVTAPGVLPPLNAAFLFYLFYDAKKADALVGDLEEQFRVIYKKFGVRRANFWCWTQVITSVGPIVRAWAKQFVMKPVVAVITWATARHLLNDGSWLVMVAEVWKRIRS